MNELDEVWAQMLNQAKAAAQAAGRGDVAEYLNLKAKNDLIRQSGVKWLFDSFTEIAAENNRKNASIAIENDHPHSFTFANANMVGSVLRLRLGVRCLSIEAGWTRTPADGFMRYGALAAARITHFGINRENADLILIGGDKNASIANAPPPQWFSIDKAGNKSLFDSADLYRHFQIFTN